MSTLPLYLAYLATAVALIAAFTGVYLAITPYREIALIRQGNSAAAVSLGGTVIGFAIALNSAAANSVSLLDMALWGALGLASQILVFLVVCMKLPGFRNGIEADRIGYGIVLAAFSIAMGIVNAGSLTY
jgi:putative membrane protein